MSTNPSESNDTAPESQLRIFRTDDAPASPNLALPREQIVAQSKLMREVLERARRFATSDGTALLLGESGTGKEVVARYMHLQSARCQRPYVRINCAAIPELLMESELFGHCRGAFTSADRDRVGQLEWAQDGTVLLDEIGDLPLRLQAKLLRVLEEGEFQRVGDNQLVPLHARIIAATNGDLAKMVEEGRFRADLYYRLFVLNLHIPALRERPDDIAPLAQHFVRSMDQERRLELSRRAMSRLHEHDWPGNIRELKNVIHRAVVLCPSTRIEEVEIVSSPSSKHNHAVSGEWPDITLAEAAQRTFEAAMQRANGNQRDAARRLGVTERTVQNMLQRYQRDAG